MEVDLHKRVMSSHAAAPASTKGPGVHGQQGIATLVVMLVVLSIIVLFCCFAAPGIRGLCRRYICRTCPFDDPDVDNSTYSRQPRPSGALQILRETVRNLRKTNLTGSAVAGESPTPTVILLPYGRMLVVDRAVFAQLHADHGGIDFMELSASLIRTQDRRGPLPLPLGSTPSILDSDATSKGISPTSLGFSPPAYEDIFGSKNLLDLPPSYSEVSLMLKQFAAAALPPPEAIELREVQDAPVRPVAGDPIHGSGDAAAPQNSLGHTIVDIPEIISVPYYCNNDDSSEIICVDETVL